jgi:hypothetical protein
MRDKLTTIAAWFIPLGFIGGLFQGDFSTAIFSSVLWTIIYLLLRGKR